MKMKNLPAALSAVLVMVGLAACDAGAEGSSGPGTSSEAKEFAAMAQELVDEASSEIPVTAPADSPSIKSDKEIVTIPCSAAAQGCKFAVDQFAAAAESVGWSTTMIDPAGDPAKMADAVNQAVSQGADGIFTVAIDSANLEAPLEAAKAAGVETVCFSCVDDPGLLLATLPAEDQHQRDGYVLAAQAFLDSGEDLKVVLLRDSEFGNTVRREQGVLDFIEDCQDAGASCELVAEQNFLVGNISTSLPQQVAGLVRNKPDWNALIAPYDASLLFVLPELRNNGLVQDEQRAYGFDPLDQNISWIRDEDVEAATLASPYDWIAYAAIDQLNRAFAGEEPVDQGVVDKLVVPSNAPDEGDTYVGDGDPAEVYKTLWGLE